MSTQLPPGYLPSPEEPFMSALQAEYFREKLLRLRAKIQRVLATAELSRNECERPRG